MSAVKEGVDLFFVSDPHKENYEQLRDQFKSSWSSEYAAAAYVAALPDIFCRIDWADQDSPVSWFFGEWVETEKEDGSYEVYQKESEIMPGLSSVHQGLVRAAVELFNGKLHQFDLLYLIGNADDKLYRVFLQLLEIRRRSSILNLADYRPDPEDGGEF